MVETRPRVASNPATYHRFARSSARRGKTGRFRTRQVEVRGAMTYTATAVREGRWWSIYVPEVDRHTQARRQSEIEPMARDLISIMTDLPAKSIRLVVRVVKRPKLGALHSSG